MVRRRKAKEAAEELAVWQAEVERLQWFLNRAQHAPGSTNAEDASIPVALQPVEHALLVLQGVELIEPRRLPGHWGGGSTGFTFHVARRVDYRAGATAGHYVEGESVATPVDTGAVTITDRRVVFTGAREAREWDFHQALGFHHYDDPAWTAIPVSGRQRISGIRYPAEAAEGFRFALALGMARALGTSDTLIADLRAQLAEVEADRPEGVPAVTPVIAPVTVGIEPSWSYPTEPVAAAPAVAPVAAPAVAPVAAPAVAPVAPVAPVVAAVPVEPVAVAAPAAASIPVAEQPQATVVTTTAPAATAPAATAPAAAPAATAAVSPEPAAATGTETPAPADQLPPPGWYPDPYGTARLRWWDGQGWTTHDAP